LDNWYTNLISKSLSLFCFSVMTMFSLFSQDISVKDIIVNDGNDFCSYDASSIEILLVLESDGAFDFRNKTFDVRVFQNQEGLLVFTSTLTISTTLCNISKRWSWYCNNFFIVDFRCCSCSCRTNIF